jgi:hypothetical protein
VGSPVAGLTFGSVQEPSGSVRRATTRWTATPMTGGSRPVPAGNRCLRLVFANEPVARLAGLRYRFAAAF